MEEKKKNLHVLWTTGEKDVAIRMVFQYLMNAKANGWWDEINLIIWGPSAKLAAEDEEIQDEIRMCLDSGITIQACKACTDSYDVTKKIVRLGVNVRMMGESFTDYLKGNDKVVTF
ncbi:MAG: DsrE family protein [Bacteroidales bacterium]|nr:DsrE family protein [Bacteroidales bacterium]